MKGFGRGSKQLGIPTANFSEELVSQLPEDLECGVYYGWAAVNNGPIHKMVMSVGWNPYYKNEKKSVETHIMSKFDTDFYGAVLRVVVLGYLRAEKNFSSLEELIDAIQTDIRDAETNLDREELQRYRSDKFFTDIQTNGTDIVTRCM